MHFRILGTVEIHDESSGRRVSPTGSKQRALLGALVVGAGHVLSSHRLIDELWGEHPPANAGNALQAHIARLRRLLEEVSPGDQARVATHSLGYLLRTGPEPTDADVFHRLSAQGRAVVTSDPERAVSVLRDALALWRGPALHGSISGDICMAEAAQLEENRLVTLETLYDASLRASLHEEITGELEELTTDHPLRERFYDLLMVALYRCGRQAEALGTYERARMRLVHELGVEPGPALRNRVQEILSHAPELTPPPPRPLAPVVGSIGTAPPAAAPERPTAATVLGIGDELDRLRRRLEGLAREQQALARRFEQLSAGATAATS
ncbi:AfsR/SARP family transcriptional regulator [Streptomyces sp. NPDC001709]